MRVVVFEFQAVLNTRVAFEFLYLYELAKRRPIHSFTKTGPFPPPFYLFRRLETRSERRRVAIILSFGYYSSWPSFALTHHMLQRMLADEVYPGQVFKAYAILGDGYRGS